MVAPTIAQAISDLEAEIGLPPGFFEGIAREDDWSFVIKLHALIEHCVTSLIVRRTKAIGLDGVVGRLRFNDTKTGKLAVARDLDLLSSEYLDFVRALCEIRNDYVHDVNFLSMSLSKYIERHSRKADLVRRVCRLVSAEGTLGPAATLFDQHPKIALQIAAMDLLADIYVGHERVRLALDEQHLAQEREKLAEQALSLLRNRHELDAKIQVIECHLAIHRFRGEGT